MTCSAITQAGSIKGTSEPKLADLSLRGDQNSLEDKSPQHLNPLRCQRPHLGKRQGLQRNRSPHQRLWTQDLHDSSSHARPYQGRSSFQSHLQSRPGGLGLQESARQLHGPFFFRLKARTCPLSPQLRHVLPGRERVENETRRVFLTCSHG